MRPRHPLAGACLLALLPMLASGAPPSSTAKKLYCWNDGGRRICSDALPPEAASRARAEINPRSGMRTADIQRTLTAEERAAQARDNELLKAQADAEAARERRDLAMVDSYATETDLRRAYGARITLLDETLQASKLGVINLRTSVLRLLEQAAEHELAGKPVPVTLASTIRTQRAELLRQQRIYALQQRGRSTLDAELLTAVERYRALKTPPTDAAEAPAAD